MKILVVGAGAVGQVYGKYLQQGGAEVTFMVKEKYRESCKKGLVLYWLNRKSGRNLPVRMTGHGAVSTAAEAAKTKWDYVLLCMSSTGLKGPWLDELIPATQDATYITLQPGLEDRDYLLTKLPASRLIEGMIPIVSYATPMAGETVAEPGIACWIPPFQKGGFSGPADKLKPLLATLQAGGFACTQVDDLQKTGVVPGVALSLVIAALESEGWSFSKLKKSSHLVLACQAMREAVEIVARRREIPSPAFQFLLTPALFRLILTLSRWVIPFDFEIYLKAHFTKVQDQMHQGVRDYITTGERMGLPVEALKKLEQARHLASTS